MLSGWLLLDKPEGLSSARALAEVKRILGVRKAGHAGTLDPMASGLLLIALGEACKFIQLLDFEEKSYNFDLKWGQATDSNDSDGQVIAYSTHMPSQDTIAAQIACFPSCYAQRPPDFSALKVGGKRAYALARAGKPVNLASREVTVTDFCLQSHTPNPPRSHLSVRLGKGGYVRALGRDFAKRCGSLGHVEHIRRTHIGKLSLNNAIPLALLRKKGDNSLTMAQEMILELPSVLDGILAIDVSDEQKQQLIHGQSIALKTLSAPWGSNNTPQGLFLLRHQHKVFGMGKIRGAQLRPHRLCAT